MNAELFKKQYPLLRGGVAAPYKQMSRYLEQGAAGEVRNMFQQGFDLPRPAEAKVAWHLLDRRDAPPRRRGYGLLQVFVQFIHSFYDRPYSGALLVRGGQEGFDIFLDAVFFVRKSSDVLLVNLQVFRQDERGGPADDPA